MQACSLLLHLIRPAAGGPSTFSLPLSPTVEEDAWHLGIYCKLLTLKGRCKLCASCDGLGREQCQLLPCEELECTSKHTWKSRGNPPNDSAAITLLSCSFVVTLYCNTLSQPLIDPSLQARWGQDAAGNRTCLLSWGTGRELMLVPYFDSMTKAIRLPLSLCCPAVESTGVVISMRSLCTLPPKM